MTQGAVAGVPRWILRLEGLAILGVSLLLYRQFGGGWALLALSAPLIWTAHLGFDRAAGYGLKYSSSFGDTHLGTLGRASGVAAGIAD